MTKTEFWAAIKALAAQQEQELKRKKKALRTKWEKQILQYIKSHPKMDYDAIAVVFELSRNTIQHIAIKYQSRRVRGRGSKAYGSK